MQNYLFDMKKQLSLGDNFVEKPNIVSGEIIPICFRDLVPQISDTTYLTHGIYYYPAKFIPHVVRYCIETYSKENETIIDPFAGSGTVGLESYLCKRNAFLLDLNLLLNHIIPVKIPSSKEKLEKRVMQKFLAEMTKNNVEFIPNWSNCEYWYPPEMLNVLKKYWGYLKSKDKDLYSRIAESALIKVSKYFSYAEHRTPKLFKSKTKKAYIEEILKTDWQTDLNNMLFKVSTETLDKINQLNSLTKNYKNSVKYFGGADSSTFEFPSHIEFDTLISSPPYLQAQEYIRTAKMDLYWLGYNDSDIKRLSSLEIPYRKPNRIIETETLSKVKARLERQDLKQMLDSYFCYVIQSFENAMIKLKKNGNACIFVGNPKIDGIDVEIWRIIKEYFIERHFTFENVYEDRIKTRQLFGMRKNKNPDGMKSEFLLVMKRIS